MLLNQCIAPYVMAPEELVLDIGARVVALPGNQELSEFHGYHDVTVSTSPELIADACLGNSCH